MPDRQLRINAPHIVHETIDGETILIHLGTGAYYSLEGLGAHAWGQLIAGMPEHEVLAHAQARYDEADPQVVADALGAFVRELLDEGLLVADGAAAGAATLRDGTPADASPGDFALPAEFVAPALSKYTDMQEFMLIDPIHDVEEEAGWPHVKAG